MAERVIEEAEWSDEDRYEAAEEGVDYVQILRGLEAYLGEEGETRRETRSGDSPRRPPSDTSRGVQLGRSSDLNAASSNLTYRREGAVSEASSVGGAATSAHAAKTRSAILQFNLLILFSSYLIT